MSILTSWLPPQAQAGMALLKGIKLWHVLAALVLCLSVSTCSYRSSAIKAKTELVVAQTAVKYERDKRIEDALEWKAKFAEVAKALADAKLAGEAAEKALAAREKQAAKDLARAKKDWERIYARPENRAWAESGLPSDVLNRLRDNQP